MVNLARCGSSVRGAAARVVVLTSYLFFPGYLKLTITSHRTPHTPYRMPPACHVLIDLNRPAQALKSLRGSDGDTVELYTNKST